MRVLIVESNPDLGGVWGRHLERRGCRVTIVCTQEDAIHAIQTMDLSIIIMDLVLDQGSAIAIADFASYRRPSAKVIFVSSSSFFTDGSIFQHIPNACAMLPSEVPPEDLGALVEHYGAPSKVNG